ncbi:MAG: hypothetical protein FWF01_00010 [Alphaproteobacteria bacterium]|nr:hypothetical protein [Alphaproteobacteria bacterium]
MTAFGVQSVQPSLLGVWRKTVQGPFNSAEGMKFARDVGFIRTNVSRLNVISSLTKGKNENWFRFQVQSSGNFRLTVRHSSSEASSENALANPDGEPDFDDIMDMFRAAGIRVEVHRQTTRGSTVIASNDETAGKAFEAFEQMMYGEFRFQQADRGEYFIRIARIDPRNNNSEEFVALQMQMGQFFRHDYTTIQAPPQGQDPGPRGNIDHLLSQVMHTSMMTTIQGASNILEIGAMNMSQFTGPRQQPSIFGTSIFDIMGFGNRGNIFDILGRA